MNDYGYVDVGKLADFANNTIGGITANDIMRFPRADVQPVKHGHWETWGYVFHGIEWKRCSLCHKTADVSYFALIEGEIKMVTSAICGCCGARMDVIYQDDKIRAIKVT